MSHRIDFFMSKIHRCNREEVTTVCLSDADFQILVQEGRGTITESISLLFVSLNTSASL